MKCTDDLMQDHKIILRSLNVLQCLANEERREPIDVNDVETLVRFLKTFADEHHHLKEESALFPEVMRKGQAQGGPLRHLLFEHDQERSLVEGLEEALHTKKAVDFAVFANRLTSRIRNHIEKEDSILFPILGALISRDQDEKIVAQFEKFQLDPRLLDDLCRLESKYLGRTAA